MLFWAGILVAILFAILWAKRGLYDTWIFAFNCIVAIYIGIFAAPYASIMVPSAGDTPFGDMLVVAGLTVGAFIVLQIISLISAIGHFTVPFPKILDVTIAGLLGFLIGIVIWNFSVFVIGNSGPVTKDIVSQFNYDERVRQFNVSVFSVPCDIVNLFVSNNNELDTQKAVASLLSKMESDQKQKTAIKSRMRTITEPNKPQQQVDTKDILGPPPEIEAKGT